MPGYTHIGAQHANDPDLKTVMILANWRRIRSVGRHRAPEVARRHPNERAEELTEGRVREIVFGGRQPPSGLDPEAVAAIRRIAEHLGRCGAD